MKTLARLTAILLIFFGLLAFLGGGYFIWRGLVQPTPLLPGLVEPGMMLPLRLLGGAGMAMQGLLLGAAGEALWLVAGIARRSEHNGQHLATLATRGSMTIP